MNLATLCETCRSMREVISGKGSRFLLCTLALSRPEFRKYPAQPVLRCEGYRDRSRPEHEPDARPESTPAEQ